MVRAAAGGGLWAACASTSGQFQLWTCGPVLQFGNGPLRPAPTPSNQPPARKKMAVATNKQAAKPAPSREAEPERAAGAVAEFGKDDELKTYRQMLLIRRFEEKAGQMYGMGLIGGFCHLYIG